MNILEIMKSRHSVRSFDGNPLSDADKKSLEDYVNSLENPFGVPVEFCILEARENNLSSPAIVGEHNLLAASPVGYPAAKRSIRESLMCKGLKADERIAFEKLFFAGSFETELTKDSAGDFGEALEMVRLAPLEVNKQPWRAVVDENRVHFYEMKTMKDSALGDIQKVDIGIALAHLDLTMEENGKQGHFIFADPGIKIPENVCYIVTYEVD